MTQQQIEAAIRAAEQFLPVLHGRMQALDYSMPVIESRTGSNTAVTFGQQTLENLGMAALFQQNRLNEAQQQWESMMGSTPPIMGDMNIMVWKYAQEVMRMVVSFEGRDLFNRPLVRAALNDAVQQIMNTTDDHDNTTRFETALGYVDMPLSTLQGFSLAIFNLELAVKAAADATLAQHAADNFDSWDDVRQYFNEQFEVTYAA